MENKIVIAGGTGFLGNYLRKKYTEAGYNVIVIGRSAGVVWENKTALVDALNNAEVLINLAGKSVNCRYNENNKSLILNSRVRTTRLLGEALKQCHVPPKLWVNASGASIYRDVKDRPNTESDIETGEGFSVTVAKEWEKAFYAFTNAKTRMVALRISIILGKDGGVIPVYKKLVRFGLGGKQGSGQQMFSWIHIEDVYRALRFIQNKESISGPVNCASPNPVSNAELMRIFRKVMNVKIGFPGPKWLLEMGAVLIGTEPELIFKSIWVTPAALESADFKFEFGEIEPALRQLLLP